MQLKLFCTFLVLSLAKFGAVHTNSNDTEAKSCVRCDKNCNDDDDLSLCIRICCPRKNMMANGGCNFEEQLFRTKLNLSIKLDDNSTEALYFNNQTLLTTPFWDIDEMIGLSRDEYTLYKNGTIYIHSDKRLKSKEEYCFYPHQIYSDFPETIWILLHEWSLLKIPGTYELTSVSLICYIIPMGIYLLVKKLRNVFGKCLVSCIFCIFLTYLIWLIDELRLMDDFCSLSGYISYFFDFATYLWLCVISFCLWKKITSVDHQEHRHQFLFYSIFVWGISCLPLGIIILMDHLWKEDLQKWNWFPLVGFFLCSVELYKWSSWAYYQGLFRILCAMNIIMFDLTIKHIKKTKKEISKFTHRPDRTPACLTVDFQKMISYMRIFTIMGVSWALLLVVMVEFKANIWNIFVVLIRVLHRGLGILICCAAYF
ncbi:probable G-protein coupled receptor Mth-like 12 [Drosophila santomea]|uniref:probable G-protein coupled receptor Mth-like 12 n=1 Tax=Drosophila santomea TaxID=129105 RepID=UPI0019535148|nr:probable G-protein coupled receptor Mth-like 12 [Drosophila santomea]